MTTTIKQPKDLLELIGHDLGTSTWLTIPQSDIDLFADATHDKQWIHVDVERAKTGPFKGPIAHGYLTLSCSSRCGQRFSSSKTSAWP